MRTTQRTKFLQQTTAVKPQAGTIADSYHKIRVSARPTENLIFSADLYDYIQDNNQISDIVEALSSLEEGDRFELRLSSGGGCLSATDTLITAMRRTKGHVHVSASGNNASAATLILLEAHSFDLSDHFTALLHCGSLSEAGTLQEFSKSAPFFTNWMQNFIRNSYAGFLSEDEIQQLLDGRDYLLTNQEWFDRSEKRNEWMQEQVEKLMKAAEDLNRPKKPRKPRERKVHAAPVEGSIPREVAKEAVKSVIEARRK